MNIVILWELSGIKSTEEQYIIAIYQIDTNYISVQAWMWANNLKGKVLYMLDWNDPINCVEEGDGSTIKLIQVMLLDTNEPKQGTVIQPE